MAWSLPPLIPLEFRLPGAEQVAHGLDDAAALDDDGIAQEPLQPPVIRGDVLRSLLHGLPEGGRWYQLCMETRVGER